MTAAATTPADTDAFNEKAAQLSTLVQELLHLAPQAASAKLGELKEQGQQFVADGKEKASQATRQVLDTVRRHPLEAMLVAVGSGLLAWWLLTRK